MSDWRDCAVTLIDVPGIKDLAARQNARASDVMRQMHSLVLQEMSVVLTGHAHVYIWNDSVLLLAFLDGNSNVEAVLTRPTTSNGRLMMPSNGKVLSTATRWRSADKRFLT
jgi:hypothetical protein